MCDCDLYTCVSNRFEFSHSEKFLSKIIFQDGPNFNEMYLDFTQQEEIFRIIVHIIVKQCTRYVQFKNENNFNC